MEWKRAGVPVPVPVQGKGKGNGALGRVLGKWTGVPVGRSIEVRTLGSSQDKKVPQIETWLQTGRRA